MAAAASAFQGFDEFPITSVHRTSNSDGSAIGAGHLEGRAVDVAVPDSKEGFEYVVRAAQSGQFQSIGTNPKWIPELERYFPNVHFFSDYKQTHAHLEVGDWKG